MSKVTQYVRHLAVVAIATLAAHCAWAGSGVISINMGRDTRSFSSTSPNQVTLAGDIPVADWIVCSQNNGVHGTTTKDGVSVVYDMATPYAADSCDTRSIPIADTCLYFKGGLARGNRASSAYSINVSGITFDSYKVYIYFTWDKTENGTNPYPAVTINDGTSYYVSNGALAEGSSKWGTGPDTTVGYTAPELWNNAMLIEGLSGSTLKLSGNCTKGAIAAIQIVDDSPYEATIDAQTTSWTDLAWGGGRSWQNGSNVKLTVAADSTLTLGSAITCGAIKVVGSANLTIADPQNLSYTKIDLSDYTGELTLNVTTAMTAGAIVGGTVVKAGTAGLGVNTKGGLAALDGTTLKINAGTVTLNSTDAGSVSKNATFVLNGGTLTNYGWPTLQGTTTFVNEADASVFMTKYLGGGSAIVKQGAGKLSCQSGSDGAFASIKVEGGILAFAGNPATATTLIAGAGAIEIPSGKTLTVGSVTGEGDINLAGTGTLKITGAISLTGKINCNGVTIDTSVRDLSAFADTVKLVATPAEIGAGKVKVTGPVGLVVTVGDVTATIGEEGTATLTIGEPQVSGNACLFDIVFNHLTDSQNRQNGTFDYKAVSATLKYDSDPTFSALDGEGAATVDTGVYIKHHPYIDGAAGTFGNLKDFTTVVVGSMSATANTQFIHFGSTASKGLFLATTGEKDKILVASNNRTTVKEITTLTVPNSSTARHVYVITKTDTETESIFTVYLDGVKRATVPMGEKVTIGTTSHSGVQVGSSFGGDLNNGTYKAVATSDNTGVINVLRVFDYIISWDQISKLTTDYPYVAEGGLFQRTIGATADYSEENTWTKAGAESAEFDVPTSQKEGFDPSFEITASETSTLTVNASASIEVATTNGGKTTFKKDGENKIAISDSFLVNNQVVVEYGALDISGALVSLRDDDCTLELDMSAYEIPMVMETTLVPLTGQIRETDKMTVTLPSDANHRHLETVYEAGRRQLKITVDTLEVTIPTVSGATSAVTVNGVAVTPTEGKITVPYNSKIVVTYTAETGKHIVGDASVTVESIEEDNIDASSITTAVNVYTITIPTVEHANVVVTVNGAEVSPTEGAIKVNHGDTVVVTYTAAEGYTMETITKTIESAGADATIETTEVTPVISNVTITIPAAPTGMTVAVTGADLAQDSTITVAPGTEFTVTYTVSEGYYGEDSEETYTAAKDTEVTAPEAPAFIPTAKAEKVTAKHEDVEVEYLFTNVETSEDFDDWEANFEVTFSTQVTTGDVTLKGAYGAFEWQTMDVENMGGISEDGVWTLLPAGLVAYSDVAKMEGGFSCGIHNVSAAKDTVVTVNLVLKKGDVTIIIASIEYTLGDPEPQGPKDWTDVTESTTLDQVAPAEQVAALTAAGATATQVAAWATKVGINGKPGVALDLDALALDCEPSAKQQTVEDEVPSIDMTELAKGDLTAAVKAISDKYPLATVQLVEATLPEGTVTTAKLYKLSITIKK